MNNTLYILMRNDDPCARSNYDQEKKVLKVFEKYNIPQVLAVIPKNVEDPHVWHSGEFLALEENSKMVELLKEYTDKGLVEIAQHGFTHQTNRLRPSIKDDCTDELSHPGIDQRWTHYQPEHKDGYSEFSGLPAKEQQEKVTRGREYLEDIFETKFDSFIFPWNTYDKISLKALKKNRFKYVPGEDDLYINPNVTVIGCCNWDWEIDRFRELLKDMDQWNKPILTQFGYHSWTLDDDLLEDFDHLMAELSQRDNVVFIMPNQIDSLCPWVKRIIKLRSYLLKIQKQVYECIDKPFRVKKYYVKDYGYYLSEITKYLFILFLLKVCGLKNSKLSVIIIKDYLLNNAKTTLYK